MVKKKSSNKTTTTKRGRKPKENKLLPDVQPIVEETIVEETIEVVEKPLIDEPVVEKTLEEKTLEEFVNTYNSLTNYYVISDKQAREFHRMWQILAHRTDYYVNCGVCSANHIRFMKKLAKNKGFEVK